MAEAHGGGQSVWSNIETGMRRGPPRSRKEAWRADGLGGLPKNEETSISASSRRCCRKKQEILLAPPPGHAVIVVDMAEDAKGQRAFLLAQSYMPAQDIHILKNPMDADLSPWCRVPRGAIGIPC